MIQLNEISPYGYGMVLYSPDILITFLETEKCRVKKLASYFDKNKDIFHKAIENGIIMPIYRISIEKYSIFVSINESNMSAPDGWEQVYKYDDFFIQVGSTNKLCWASFEFFNDSKTAVEKRPTTEMQIVPHGYPSVMLPVYQAVDIDIPQGYYNYDLIAYKRIKPLDETKQENANKNYAYGFQFKSTNTLQNENLIKGDNENDIFKYDIDHMERRKIFTVEESEYIDFEKFYLIEDFLRLDFNNNRIPYHLHDLENGAFLGMDEKKRLYKITRDHKITPIEETIIEYFSREKNHAK
jgi:hypothetical protein